LPDFDPWVTPGFRLGDPEFSIGWPKISLGSCKGLTRFTMCARFTTSLRGWMLIAECLVFQASS